MKTMKKASIFFAGMVASFALCLCVTTALAVSGTVSFNQANVTINDITLFEKDQPLTTQSGTTIPSTLTYTDEQGNTSHYVSVRAMAEALGMNVAWEGDTDTVELALYNSVTTYLLNTYFTDTTAVGVLFNDALEEVEPILAQDGTVLLPPTEHFDTVAFETALPIQEGAGNYVSVTVTNYQDYPVRFGLGQIHNSESNGAMQAYGTVPANSTVTRTF